MCSWLLGRLTQHPSVYQSVYVFLILMNLISPLPPTPVPMTPDPCSIFCGSLSVSKTKTQIKNVPLYHGTIAKAS